MTTPASLPPLEYFLFGFFVAALVWLTVRAARRVRLHMSMRFSDALSAVMGAVAAVLIFLAVAAYLLVV
ncbi:hypothetical protein [Nonomuraea maritima]|uniref:hypothetical protein n=1 Tax=Nonomuraea maritima TaxID=683260 RepID=UPI003711ECBD